jgi:hypothetical protein
MVCWKSSLRDQRIEGGSSAFSSALACRARLIAADPRLRCCCASGPPPQPSPFQGEGAHRRSCIRCNCLELRAPSGLHLKWSWVPASAENGRECRPISRSSRGQDKRLTEVCVLSRWSSGSGTSVERVTTLFRSSPRRGDPISWFGAYDCMRAPSRYSAAMRYGTASKFSIALSWGGIAAVSSSRTRNQRA